MKPYQTVLHLAVGALALLTSDCDDDPTQPPPSTPPTATFSPVASLPGYLPYGEPWSPNGARLAYKDSQPDSIAVFDAMTPHLPPRRLGVGAFREVRWSPDGEWLILVQPDGWPLFTKRLIVARLPRPNVPALVLEVAPPNLEIDHAVWGSDGNIYWWNMETGKRTALPPPAEWRSENPDIFPERTQLMPRVDLRTRMLGQFVFETVPAVVEIPINVLVEAPIEYVLGDDVVPGGQQFLMTIVGPPCEFTARVDRSGAILTRYWTPCASGPPGGPFTYEGGGSVSADQRFVIGYREVEDGHSILSSQLILTDLQASWIVEVEGTSMGIGAEFAATGLFVAYSDLRGVVEVGVLDVR